MQAKVPLHFRFYLLFSCSKYMALPCDIKLRHALFSSDISNKIADNLGYTTDVELRYGGMKISVKVERIKVVHFFSFDEIQRIDPSLKFENIQSSKAALRTWTFDGK